MSIVKRILDFIIYGNFYISVCAFLLIYESYILLKIPHSFFYPVFGFFATLFIYNIDRLIASGKLGKLKTERHQWLTDHLHTVLAFTFISALVLLTMIFFVKIKILLFLLHLAVISIAYSIPFVFKGHSREGLRSITGLKIFLITYVWCCTTVLIPAIDAGMYIFDREVILLFIERCLFIFIICLPFDIRDYKIDRQNNIKTIPTIIGIDATLKLTFACIIIFLLVSTYHYPFGSGLFWARYISGITTFIFVYKTKQHYHEYYFTGLLDGTMIIQFFLIYFLHDK